MISWHKSTRSLEHVTSPEQDRPGLVGLHNPRPRDPRRRRQALAAGPGEARATRLPRRPLRHAPRVLPCRGPGVRQRLATVDRRQPGGHLRPDRPHGTVAAGGAAGERPGPRRAAGSFLGHGRVGGRGGRARAGHAPVELCPGRPRALFPADSPRAADARLAPALSHGRSERLLGQLRRNPLRGHARRPGRGEALGLQRPAPPQGPLQGCPARTRGVSQAQDPRDRLAPHDDHPECTDLRRRAGFASAQPGGHGRACRDMEGRAGFHLARGQSRQSVWHAAHGLDDL